MPCDIIIPIWNQLNLTRNCVEHIVKNTAYPYRLILIDNASADDTREYLRAFKEGGMANTELIHNENNLGFVKAANQGMRISNAPYVCVLNNDTMPAPGWLEELVEFAESHKEIGIMNPQCGRDMRIPFDDHAADLKKNNKGRFMEMNQCFGYCMLIKREVIERIGYLDEAFGMGSYDDTDYSMRAYKAGYLCANVHSSYVHHIYNASFKALGGQGRIVAAGEREYFRKWPRHLRAAIAASLSDSVSDGEIENILRAILFLAREWCWVNFWIFGDKALNKKRIAGVSEKIGMPLHQNIKFNYFANRFRDPRIIARVLERSFGAKRRKRYDMILIDEGPSASFLKMVYPLHGTRIRTVNSKQAMVPELDRLISDIRRADKKD